MMFWWYSYKKIWLEFGMLLVWARLLDLDKVTIKSCCSIFPNVYYGTSQRTVVLFDVRLTGVTNWCAYGNSCILYFHMLQQTKQQQQHVGGACRSGCRVQDRLWFSREGKRSQQCEEMKYVGPKIYHKRSCRATFEG